MMKFGMTFRLFCLIALLSACVLPESGIQEAARKPFDPDLFAWKTASWTPFTVSDSITGFAYGRINGKDRYVAAASTGVIGWSNDGDIWQRAVKAPDDPSAPSPDPFNASFNAVAFGGGVFVAVGNGGKIARSTDGINWTAAGHSGGITGFGTENIMGIAWGKGVFVAVGGNANIAYSSNGIDWTGCRDAAFGTSQLNDIAFDSYRENGRFYIVGNDGKRGWSDDLTSGNWHLLELPNMDTPPFGKNHIRKVNVGYRGAGIGIGIVFNEWGGKRTAISSDAAFGGIDADLDAGLFGDNTINGIAWGGGYFAAAGSSAIIGWWPSAEPSNDVQRYWRALCFTEFQWWEITALAAMKDRFFVGGIGGKIGYSK